MLEVRGGDVGAAARGVAVCLSLGVAVMLVPQLWRLGGGQAQGGGSTGRQFASAQGREIVIK